MQPAVRTGAAPVSSIMQGVDVERRFFRSKFARTFAAYCMTMGCVAALSATASATGWGAAPYLVVGLLLVGYGMIYAWRLGVEAIPVGLRLHNPMGSRVVPWAEVDRFELGNVYPWRVWLVTRIGTRVKTWGLGASGIKHRMSMVASQELVDELNSVVRLHRDHA